MKKTGEFDNRFLIIGSGPGGEAISNRLSQLGAKNIAVIEQGPIGGVCVNWGCIPTHFLLHNLIAKEHIAETNLRHRLFSTAPEIDFNALKSGRKRVIGALQLSILQNFKKNGIEFIQGKARILTPNKVEITRDDGTVIFKTAETIIVASGASFVMPDVHGIDGVGKHLIRADRVMALEFDKIPKSVVIWGFDSPAVEIACFFRLFGSEVALLCPYASAVSYGSAQLGETVEQMLEFHDIEFYKNAQLNRFKNGEDGKIIVEFHESEKKKSSFECDVFVNAFRRQSNLECIKEVPIKQEDKRSMFSETFESSMNNIFFLGDVRSGNSIPFRSHLAAFGGKLLAERLMGNRKLITLDLNLIPRGMTTIDFQIAKIGLTEQEATNEGFNVKTLQIPNAYNAFAHILGKLEGYVSLIIEKAQGRILGGEIVGPDAINLITVIGTAIACEGTIHDLRKFPGFHPSLSEGVFDCAWLEK